MLGEKRKYANGQRGYKKMDFMEAQEKAIKEKSFNMDLEQLRNTLSMSGFKKQEDNVKVLENPGDWVKGMFVNIEASEKHDGAYWVKLHDPAKGVISIMGNKVLKHKLEGASEGDDVVIVYAGMETSGKGRDYHTYEVWLKKAKL